MQTTISGVPVAFMRRALFLFSEQRERRSVETFAALHVAHLVVRGFGRARLQEFRVEVAGARSADDHDRRICAAGRGDGRRDFRPIAAAHPYSRGCRRRGRAPSSFSSPSRTVFAAVCWAV